MPEPADLRRPYTIDMDRLHGDMQSISDGTEGIPGVQIIDPRADRIADMVAAATAAAVDALQSKSSPVEIRQAARTAALKGADAAL